MTTLQVVESAAYGNAQIKLRLLSSSASQVGGSTTLRVLNTAAVNLASGTTLRVLNSSAVGTAGAQAAISGPATATALQVVTLDASSSVGTITGITQTAGTPTVTLSGSGNTRTFAAPAIFDATGASHNLTFQVAVSGGGTATCVVAVIPWGEWTVGPSPTFTWLPRFRYGRDSTTTVPGGVVGWGAQVAKIDFTTPVAVGGFVPDSSGNLTSQLGGSPGFLAYQDVLNVGSTAPQTLSVTTDGYLDIWVHRVSGNPVVTTIKPNIPAMTYGRYAFRYKVLAAGLGDSPLGTSPLGVQAPGWACTIGLLPVDGVIPDHGQVDAASGDLSDDVLVFNTPASPTGVRSGASTATPWTDWHVGVIEIKPASLKLIHDGVTVYQTTSNIPNTPMVFSIRPTGNSVSGAHILFDYIAAWQV